MLIFGPLAAQAGTRKLCVNVDSLDTASLRAALLATRPDLAKWIESSRLAVNHEFALEPAAISPGDELALIGAVSGG